ncbi:glycerophosphodiester phosphodiesterase family protein [Vibrio lentus]|uniref:glycerophosphodiester phosphodiesterase family protein n=1 Tax=Vibrio lentus TaxID=136468 RepID=UPI000C854767|nr:glycerophosphodiester phosphodiesterase family protein [Vibrio lentus]PMG22170.1 glycerophosphoryl diester phosphodiesterase [Vibrio lentus]PMH05903.1 glycerophosphoryl diester phosphodiesterase [Vibrio lentus]PMJ12457.1 glycerophosphoryl diester phosphodiesterase [Vibrio lentus]PMK89378.1 glycerophosphoryl diester phosphodiesterase [Vibrio lentus]PMN17085.1 glycerophosphoryl diester phosphodiesterase [Vibrio lentus]
MITGHRGAASLAPENTLVSIEQAAKAGASWVEIDTQLSADGIPMVFHDRTVDRCTNGTGNIADLDLTSLKALDAGSWFGSEFIGTSIPTLSEALDKCLELDLTLNLELKIYNDKAIKPLVDQVIALIKQKNFPSEKLLISSFKKDALSQCQELMPEVRRGFICEVWNDFSLESLKSLDLYSIHIDHRVLDEKTAKAIKGSGAVLKIWTLNDPQLASKYLNLGVDNIITDVPNKF